MNLPALPSAEQIVIAQYRRQNISLSEIRAFLDRSRWVIALIFLGTVVAAYAVLALFVDKYEAEARLLVRVGPETVDPPATAVSRGGTLISSGVRREEVGSEVSILTSMRMARDVVKGIGVERFFAIPPAKPGFVNTVKYELKAVSRTVKAQYQEALILLGLKKRLTREEQAVTMLQKEVAASIEKESDVILLKFRTADPALGEEVLRRWITLYLVQRVEARGNKTIYDFLSAEVRRAKNRLDEAENARNEWKRTNRLSQTDAQKQSLIQQLKEASGAHDLTLSTAQALSGQINEANAQLSKLPRQVRTTEVETANPTLQTYRGDLAAAELEKTKLLSKYDAKSERIQMVDDEITRLRDLIGKEERRQISSTTLEINPLVNSLQARLQEDTVRLEGLTRRAALEKQQMSALSRKIATLESADLQLMDLERERQVAEDLYLGIVKRQNEASVTSELDRSRLSNVSVIAPPETSIEPVSPKRELIMGASLILGLLLGVVLPLVRETLSGTLRTPEDFARVSNIPYLGTLGPGEDAPE